MIIIKKSIKYYLCLIYMELIVSFIKINWIEIVGSIFGLLYLYYEYKADTRMWATGIIMSSFYTIVFVHATFYAFAGINIYYILAGIYGWIKWHKPQANAAKTTDDIGLRHTPTLLFAPLAIVSVVLFGIVVFILQTYTDSQVVYGDSFVTTITIVAMWMLAQKYVEQWLPLIVVNIVSVFLFMYQDLYPTAIMYVVYSIVSVFGYMRWKKLVTKDHLNENI